MNDSPPQPNTVVRIIRAAWWAFLALFVGVPVLFVAVLFAFDAGWWAIVPIAAVLALFGYVVYRNRARLF